MEYVAKRAKWDGGGDVPGAVLVVETHGPFMPISCGRDCCAGDVGPVRGGSGRCGADEPPRMGPTSPGQQPLPHGIGIKGLVYLH